MSTDGSNRTRTRQRIAKPPPALAVPDIDEDAAERKRVLNVLAQRRYRERKKQDRLKGKGTTTGDAEGNVQQHVSACTAQDVTSTDSGSTSLLEMDLDWTTVDDGSLATLLPDTTADALMTQSINTLGSSTRAFFSQPLSGAPLPTMGPMSMLMTDDTALYLNDDSSPSLTDHHTHLGHSSSSDRATSSEVSFPDSYLLPVNELTLLKAFLRIAGRIGVKEADVWNLDCPSPFHIGSGAGAPPPPQDLPATWRPTGAQISLPHHPVFDFILPWPEARNRIITIMSLPDEARPPSARGPLAMVNFVYDVEDSAEGVRIYGSDPYDPASWEVGQVLFERWWFLFDRAIVANSNRWRELRGAPPLLLNGSG